MRAAVAYYRISDPERAVIVVTHYQRLLNFIVPDFVHIMIDGRIVRSGGKLIHRVGLRPGNTREPGVGDHQQAATLG